MQINNVSICLHDFKLSYLIKSIKYLFYGVCILIVSYSVNTVGVCFTHYENNSFNSYLKQKSCLIINQKNKSRLRPKLFQKIKNMIYQKILIKNRRPCSTLGRKNTVFFIVLVLQQLILTRVTLIFCNCGLLCTFAFHKLFSKSFVCLVVQRFHHVQISRQCLFT